MSKPLEGIRVVELGTHVAVPITARMMADWGSEVIKIEPPGGDPWRKIGVYYQLPIAPDNNPTYQPTNANKKSLTLDLKAPEGKEALMKLLATADIFITNTRIESLVRLGLDYASLKDKFPKLIYAHLSGYGIKGPDKDAPGLDAASFWSRSGIIRGWTYAEDRPFKPLGGVGDACTGSLLLAGILAALYNRTKTGKGEELQTSLFAAGLWYNNVVILMGQPICNQKFPKSILKTHTMASNRQSKDGDWFLLQETKYEENVSKYLEFFHLEHLIGDPRIMTVKGCIENSEFVLKVYDEAFASVSTKELSDFLTNSDVVYQILTNPNDVTNDEQAWANGYLTKLKLEDGSEAILPTNPVKFTGVGPAEFKLAPQLGQDSAEILESLGYSSEQINAMIEKRVTIAR